MFKTQDLYFGFTEAQSHPYDWSEGYTEAWDYYEAVICDECDGIALVRGEERHSEADDAADCDAYLYGEGPMMNYYYPVDVDRVGGPEEAARAIADLPLCVVEFHEAGRPDYALALTGGGMDLRWEICEAYTRLGYLPPIAFAHLPECAGKELGDRERAVLEALRRALNGVHVQVSREIRYLEDLQNRMFDLAQPRGASRPLERTAR